MKKKNIALLLSAVLVLVGVVGVTIAWLTDNAGAVTNTFTVGNIDILLDEADVDNSSETDRDTENTYKMIPGFTYAKDPKVTVVGGSEDCWLFVKVTKSNDYDNFLTFAIADGWDSLAGVDGVYCRKVSASATAQEFDVIKGNTVTVSDQVTKQMMDQVGENFPTITFEAAAIQLKNNNTSEFTAKQAWAELPTEFTGI